MLKLIVIGAETYVVGQWAQSVGAYAYEVTRCALDYYFLDENSPGNIMRRLKK